jgi:GWxTD domain-containing protein
MSYETRIFLSEAGAVVVRKVKSHTRYRILALLAAGVMGASSTYAAAKVQLAHVYRDFISGPPSLLVTKDERTAFQHLQTNPERDAFIEHFWEVRNPTPGLSSNEFKEEFYRRVAYADSFYGKDSGSQGWRTDRGRTYILFGKPQTSMSYHGNQELNATELWFYSNPGLSELPPFFYVLFYEPNGAGGYRIYQPYVDGPDKLLREGGDSKSRAYRYLRQISAELANATLSWIPGEPIDTQTFGGSMASMQIVNAIHGYSEMPSYVSTIRMRSLRMERVTSKIEYKVAQSDLLTFVALENGKPWVHWRMQVSDPVHMKWTAGKASLSVHSKLYSQGRLVFERSDEPSFAVPAAEAEQISKRPFIYEDKIPVEAGKYQLAVELKNGENGAVYESGKEFEIKAVGDRTGIGDVLVVAKHQPEMRPRPFEFAGVKFDPSAQNYVMSSRGLSILYQIQLPAERPKELIAHYAVGNVASTVKKTYDDKLDAAKADLSGTLLTAKTLPIEELGPGPYRLSVQVEDPNSKLLSTTAIPFTVIAEVPPAQPIVIARGQSDSPQSKAAIEYERALCLLSQNRPWEAIQDLQASWELSRNSTVKSLLDQLSAIRPDGSAGATNR